MANVKISDIATEVTDPADLAHCEGEKSDGTPVRFNPAILGSGAVDMDHIDTTETIGSTGSFVDLATVGPAVTLATGTRAKVTISCDVKMTTSFSGNTAFMSFEVSGDSSLAADNARAVWINGHSGFDTNFNIPLERTFIVEGLTAGSNTFTAKFKKDGQNWSFGNRRIIVEAL